MEIGTVRRVDIEHQMRGAYLDYAMSVITQRALPNVRDGLKPVQRRILYAMNDMGLHHNAAYKKSARIVGEVLGKYHPHGDAAVYDAMVRMAQDFSMRYPLIDGQGNFGSIDGDGAAAMRYTEARLAAIAEEMLADIDKDTVDFQENFDGTLKEPTILPSKLPNLLISGASGIAVGMATNVPPHNLSEVCDAVDFLIRNYKKIDDISVDEIMNFIKGPDFPTGGTIMGLEGLRTAYATGKGKIVVRSKAHFEDLRGGKTAIIVTEIPYQVNKSSLIERIAKLVREKRLDYIADLRDESDRTGMRIVIELKRGANAKTALNQLLKHTQLQTTFGVNMLALVDGQPRVLSLKRILQLFIEHRREVITRRSRFELKQAEHRAHVLEGLKIALDNLDAIIETIRRSRDADTALRNLRRKFKLTEIQARAILDMQLRRLAALERRKIEKEYEETLKRIKYLKGLLASPKRILDLIRKEMQELKAKYGDARRTRVSESKVTEFEAEDLIAEEDVLIMITQRGYIRRESASRYRTSRRGARGSTGIATRESDSVLYIFAANTLDTLLFFTNQGRVFTLKAHQVPDVTRQSRGIPLSNLIAISSGEERVTAALAVPDFKAARYLTMATLHGQVKRCELSEFESVRPSGIVAIGLKEGDELGWVQMTSGDQEIILVTARGKAIRFSENEIRLMGRSAAGVKGINLQPEDWVASMDLVRDGHDLLITTEKGYSKRSPLSEYPLQRRNGGGVLTLDPKKLEQSGLVTSARVVGPNDEVAFVSSNGMVLRVKVSSIPRTKRASWSTIIRKKDKVMDLPEGEQLVSVTRLGAEVSPGSVSTSDQKKPSTRRKKQAKKASTAKATSKSTKKTASKKVSATRASSKTKGAPKVKK